MEQSQSDRIEACRGWLVMNYRGEVTARFSANRKQDARRQVTHGMSLRRETYSEAARRLGIRLN